MRSTPNATDSELLAIAINIHASHQEIYSRPGPDGERIPEYGITVEDVMESIVRMHSVLPDESPQYAEMDHRVEGIFNAARFGFDLERLQNEILLRLGFG